MNRLNSIMRALPILFLVLTGLILSFLSVSSVRQPDMPLKPVNAAERYPEAAKLPAAPVTILMTTAASTTTATTTSASTTVSTASTQSASETSSTSEDTTTAQTTSSSAMTETTTTENTSLQEDQPAETEAAASDIYDFISTGSSPNAELYQSRLAVLGDSIAYGYCAYGYIPDEHNIAAESAGLWNLYSFSFDKGGGEMDPVSTAGYLSPQLLLVSIGMNDVIACDPYGFYNSYCSLLAELSARLPDTVIVASSITPVSDGCYYTGNDSIRSYNESIYNAVSDTGSDRILYFDAYSVLADPDTLSLNSWYGGGDGLHLSSSAYSAMLSTLFNLLDYYSIADILY